MRERYIVKYLDASFFSIFCASKRILCLRLSFSKLSPSIPVCVLDHKEGHKKKIVGAFSIRVLVSLWLTNSNDAGRKGQKIKNKTGKLVKVLVPRFCYWTRRRIFQRIFQTIKNGMVMRGSSAW